MYSITLRPDGLCNLMHDEHVVLEGVTWWEADAALRRFEKFGLAK